MDKTEFVQKQVWGHLVKRERDVAIPHRRSEVSNAFFGSLMNFWPEKKKTTTPGRLTAGTCPHEGLVQIMFLSFHG